MPHAARPRSSCRRPRCRYPVPPRDMTLPWSRASSRPRPQPRTITASAIGAMTTAAELSPVTATAPSRVHGHGSQPTSRPRPRSRAEPRCTATESSTVTDTSHGSRAATRQRPRAKPRHSCGNGAEPLVTGRKPRPGCRHDHVAKLCHGRGRKTKPCRGHGQVTGKNAVEKNALEI